MTTSSCWWSPDMFGYTERGMSLVDAPIVLTIAALLSAAAAPVASRTIDRAKLSRASSDAKAIKAAINNFLTEFTAFTPFTSTGLIAGTTIQMLVGDGDTPRTLGT